MNSEDIINSMTALIEHEGSDAIAAVLKGGQISVLFRGDEQTLGGLLITLLGSGKISDYGLSVIGAYCIAHAKGLEGFRDANGFADYLMGCAEVYFQHSDMIGSKKKGLS